MSKTLLRDLLEIPQYNPDKKEIPLSAGEIKDQRDLETEKLLISFKYYNKHICNMDVLDKSAIKKSLKAIRTVGTNSMRDLRNNGFIMKPVSNSGEYTELFNGLPKDADVKEEMIGGHERLFYFISGERHFNVVAFKNKHYRLDKSE